MLGRNPSFVRSSPSLLTAGYFSLGSESAVAAAAEYSVSPVLAGMACDSERCQGGALAVGHLFNWPGASIFPRNPYSRYLRINEILQGDSQGKGTVANGSFEGCSFRS